MEARLDPTIEKDLGKNIENAKDALLSARMDSPLRQTESWYALNVKQQIMPNINIKGGFQTKWAHSL